MKKHCILRCIALAFVTASASLPAQFTNGQNADQVIGQASFTDTGNNPISNAYGLAVDPVTGKLFVVDGLNNRVLRYANVDSLAAGAQPEAAFGQPDLVTVTPGLAANKLDDPRGMSLDASGNLWVCDRDNNRVVRFSSAAAAATGVDADLVIGQPDFLTNTPNLTQDGLDGPESVVLDLDGNLWIADEDNDRILRYADGANASNGQAADNVLGQPNFTTNGNNLTQAGNSGAFGLAVSPGGTLYVADTNNNRISVFINAALKGNNAPADSVIGQPDFVTGTANLQIFGFDGPRAVAIAPNGSLAVGESDANRVVIHPTPETVFGFSPASAVLGKPFFTTNTPTTADQSTTSDVFGVFYDAAGRLWLSDTVHDRVLRFDPDVLEANSFQPAITTQRKGKSKAIFIVRNTGSMAADFSLRATLRDRGGSASTRMIYNGQNIKGAARAGTALTGVLPPNGTARIVVRGRKKGSSPGPVRTRTRLFATSVAYSNLTAFGGRTIVSD